MQAAIGCYTGRYTGCYAKYCSPFVPPTVTQALLQDGSLRESVSATREKTLAFLGEPFHLNVCRIGEGRLGAVLAPALGAETWALAGQLNPAMAAALVPLLTVNAAVTAVDLSDNKLSPEHGVAIAQAAASMPRLVTLTMLQNRLDATAATRLAAVAAKGCFSLCGIAPDQTAVELIRCVHHARIPLPCGRALRVWECASVEMRVDGS